MRSYNQLILTLVAFAFGKSRLLFGTVTLVIFMLTVSLIPAPQKVQAVGFANAPGKRTYQEINVTKNSGSDSGRNKRSKAKGKVQNQSRADWSRFINQYLNVALSCPIYECSAVLKKPSGLVLFLTSGASGSDLSSLNGALADWNSICTSQVSTRDPAANFQRQVMVRFSPRAEIVQRYQIPSDLPAWWVTDGDVYGNWRRAVIEIASDENPILREGLIHLTIAGVMGVTDFTKVLETDSVLNPRAILGQKRTYSNFDKKLMSLHCDSRLVTGMNRAEAEAALRNS